MVTPISLCKLPPEPSGGCCDLPAVAPVAPLIPSNAPGLSAITYRIGTFNSFRRAMLDRVTDPRLLDFLNTANIPTNPFARWHEGTHDDYQTLFIELWAYLADILTFYQERIANEAYLPTATQRDSLLRLAQLINYHPSPGAGANALLAFTVEARKQVNIPTSFRVGSKALPGKPAAVFETERAITARGEYSAIRLSSVIDTNQFAPLASIGTIFDAVSGTSPPPSSEKLQQAAPDLYGDASAALINMFEAGSAPAGKENAPATTGTYPFGFLYNPFKDSKTTRKIVLEGTNNRLAVGDYVLIVKENKAVPPLRKLTEVIPDKATNTTEIYWDEKDEPDREYDLKAELYAFRVTAGPFGNNAPNWYSLPEALNNMYNDPKYRHAPYSGRNWDARKSDWYFLPTPGHDDASFLYLDAVYTAARAPDWVALKTGEEGEKTFHVTDVQPVSKAAYAISARATRLTLDQPVPIHTFPLRSTVILTGCEKLTLHNSLPLPLSLGGRTLVLAGLYPELQAGQKVTVRGTLYDSQTNSPLQTVDAESAILADVSPPVPPSSITIVTLKEPLHNTYVRASTVLMANVVEATQGETVRDEVLGSGDSSAFQSYPLKQKPLTYLPSTDPEGLAAVESTLTVTVNHVRWNERSTLLESQADAQDFTTTLDDNDQTTIIFGDGIHGARPPTGRDNIHARYRKGLGTSGNVAADAIQRLIDSMPGLQKVTNPQPSIGGTDRESIGQIRVNAPASLRTFGRAVSAADYAALALTYPGVAKASAAWMLRDATTLQAIPQPYIQLTIATASRVSTGQQKDYFRDLRNFLNARRDPNVSLRILGYTKVYIDGAAIIDVDDNYPRQATLAAACAALNPGLNPDNTAGYFAFERLEFGQSIHLSAVYAVLHSVPGVKDATITTLRRLGNPPEPPFIVPPDPPLTVRNDIFIRPTELAVIENKPDDPENRHGKLTITWGKGGYIDA